MKTNNIIRPEFYCSWKQLHFRLNESCNIQHGESFSLYESEDGFVLTPEPDGLWKVYVVPNRLPGFFSLSRMAPVRRIMSVLQSAPGFQYTRYGNSFHIILKDDCKALDINDMKKYIPDRYKVKENVNKRGPYYVPSETGEKRTFVRLCSESIYFPYRSAKAMLQNVRVSFYEADGLFGLFPDSKGLLKIKSNHKNRSQFRITNRAIYQYLLNTTGKRLFSCYRQDGDRFYFSPEPITKIPARESFRKIEPDCKRHCYLELYDRRDQKKLMAFIGRDILTPRVSFYHYKSIWALVSERNGIYCYHSKDATIHCADLVPQLRQSLHCGEYARLFVHKRNGIVYFQAEPFIKPPPQLKLFTRIT
ncbi:MAG: hypothetical protein PHQ75_05840 [Thermoguttaceae bacterium]|nr:hypothetical protein [Thermoguttaceae bacterium]